MAKIGALAVLASAAYEQEWQEFQSAQGFRNGDIPQAFKENVDFVKAHNANRSNTFQLSYAGKFADLSHEEYKRVLGYHPRRGVYGDLPRVGAHTSSGATIDDIDWTQRAAVTPVKDQKHCGSCWAFSATGSLEGQWALATGSLTGLSEQQLVDCSEQDSGCQGGLMDNAFAFYGDRSVASEASYPYAGREGTCRAGFAGAIPPGGVTGYKDVVGEADLQDAVASVGPVSVAIEADQRAFQLYSKGVLTGSCGSDLDHGVLAVGFGTLRQTFGTHDYWKVKNSWGSTWGMDGYVLIERGTNRCGIGDQPSYPTVDADAPPAPPCADTGNASFCKALVDMNFCDTIGSPACLKSCDCCTDSPRCGDSLRSSVVV